MPRRQFSIFLSFWWLLHTPTRAFTRTTRRDALRSLHLRQPPRREPCQGVLGRRAVQARSPPFHPKARIHGFAAPTELTIARTSTPASPQQTRVARKTSRRAVRVLTRASDDDDKASDSSSYRAAGSSGDEESGFFGKFIKNLPDGRKGSAPESYGARPASKTLAEGRYRRPPPERVGGVTESSVRGDDLEVVEGPSFGVGTLVGALVAVATLGAVFVTVNKISEGPVVKTTTRMPERDTVMLGLREGRAAGVVAAPELSVEE